MPDKSVGKRVAGVRAAERYRRVHAPPKFSISIPRSDVKCLSRSFFRTSFPIGCHNCIAPIDADSNIAPNIAMLRSRSSVINGISTGLHGPVRDFRTITVTVTIMGSDNDDRNSDSSIFVELATQYRSNRVNIAQLGDDERCIRVSTVTRLGSDLRTSNSIFRFILKTNFIIIWCFVAKEVLVGRKINECCLLVHDI